MPTDFPYRDTIVFVTFVVILGTLVGQVLTLPGLIRVLHVEDDDSAADREDAKARIKAAEAALARLEELETRTGCARTPPSACGAPYNFRTSRFRARYDGVDGRRRGGALAGLPAPAA